MGSQNSGLVSELGRSRLALSSEMSSFVTSISRGYQSFAAVANYLQAPLLLAVRVLFFWQLFLSGKGKLLNIDKTAEFFGSLNIPMPVFSAYLGPEFDQRDIDRRLTAPSARVFRPSHATICSTPPPRRWPKARPLAGSRD